VVDNALLVRLDVDVLEVIEADEDGADVAGPVVVEFDNVGLGVVGEVAVVSFIISRKF